MRATHQNEKIIAVLTKYSLTCETADDVVLLRDKKNRVIGTIEIDGTITRKQLGTQQLMGSLIRNDLRSALSE